MRDKSVEELKKLVGATANDCISNDEIAEMAAEFCRDHAPALIDRMEQFEELVRRAELIIPAHQDSWHVAARTALSEGAR